MLEVSYDNPLDHSGINSVQLQIIKEIKQKRIEEQPGILYNQEDKD